MICCPLNLAAHVQAKRLTLAVFNQNVLTRRDCLRVVVVSLPHTKTRRIRDVQIFGLPKLVQLKNL